MSDQIMIGNCPECGHFPSQLVGDAESLDYVIHLPEKDYGCQAGPHKRIHQLESQLEQERARVAELEDLVRFLAQTWTAVDSFVYQHCDGDALCHYPVVQGTRNQRSLREIGRQAYDRVRLNSAVNAMLQQKADEAEKEGK